MPPGMGPGEMSKAAENYYNYYLDGKSNKDSDSEDATGDDEKPKRKGKDKVPAKNVVDNKETVK